MDYRLIATAICILMVFHPDGSRHKQNVRLIGKILTCHIKKN